MRTENKNTILIVEDDFIIAMDEKIALEEYGYDVLTAKSGEAAIEIMRGNHPVDLILMDIDLGTGMDGIATAETILKFREIPIAFLFEPYRTRDRREDGQNQSIRLYRKELRHQRNQCFDQKGTFIAGMRKGNRIPRGLSLQRRLTRL